MKKRIIIVSSLVILCLLVAGLIGYNVIQSNLPIFPSVELTSQQVETLDSFKKVDKYPFYVMTYNGDYPTKEKWQAATNFLLYGADYQINKALSEYQASGQISKDINGNSLWRYITIQETINKLNGKLNMDDAMNLLKTISLTGQFPTEWSVVYNMISGDIRIAIGRVYDKTYNYKLKMKAGTNKPGGA